MRSQEEQNGSLTGLTKPISPRPSANANRRAVDEAFAGQLDEGAVRRLDQRADLGAGEHLVLAPRLVGVERHELDEPDDVRLAARELGERRHLGLGEALDRDAVDLDRAQLRIALRLLEAGEHAVERVAAGDLREAHVAERVERDVDAA